MREIRDIDSLETDVYKMFRHYSTYLRGSQYAGAPDKTKLSAPLSNGRGINSLETDVCRMFQHYSIYARGVPDNKGKVPDKKYLMMNLR